MIIYFLVEKVYRITGIIGLLLMLLPCNSLAQASRKFARHIAEVASVKEDLLPVFEDKTLVGESITEFTRGDKVVVLKRTSEIARVLLGDGTEAFVQARALKVGASLTLAGAISRVEYFEKQAGTDPVNSEYWEKLGAPWVALVARVLASKPGAARLPAPTSLYQDSDSPPALKVENNTKYVIRVYMTGSRTVSKSISAGDSWSETFPAGSYRVVAEATSGNVLPLHTTWILKTGYRHEITLYIRTTRL